MRVTAVRGYVYSQDECQPGEVWAAMILRRPDGSCLMPFCWDLPMGGNVKSGDNPQWIRTVEADTFNGMFFPTGGPLVATMYVGRWVCNEYWCRMSTLEATDYATQSLDFVSKGTPTITGVQVDYQYADAPQRGRPEWQYIAEGFADRMHDAVWPVPDRGTGYTVDKTKVLPWVWNVEGTWKINERRPPRTPPGEPRYFALYRALEMLWHDDQQPIETDYLVGLLPSGAIGGGKPSEEQGISILDGDPYTPLYIAHEMGHLYGLDDLTSLQESGQVGWDTLGRTYGLPNFSYEHWWVRDNTLTEIMVSPQDGSQDHYLDVLGAMPSVPASSPPTVAYYLVQGSFLEGSGQRGVLSTAMEFTGSEPVSSSQVGNAAVRLLDSLGAELWMTKFEADEEGPSPISVRLPVLPDSAAIELYRDGSLQDVLVRSPNIPAVTVTWPIAGQALTDTLDVRWSATDADGDTLLADVLYSGSNGESWVSLAASMEEQQVSLSTADLPSSDAALLRVRVNDGFNTAVAEISGLQLGPNRHPRACIFSPEDGMVVGQGRNIVLLGRGFDPEDGDLAGDSLTWYSDRDGLLASGSGLNIRGPLSSDVPLSLGTHVIELRARDSHGLTARDYVTITVH